MPFGEENIAFGLDRMPFGEENIAFGLDRMPFGEKNIAFGLDRMPFGEDKTAFCLDRIEGFRAGSTSRKAFIPAESPMARSDGMTGLAL
jgi:translation elongation factor EF-1beta